MIIVPSSSLVITCRDELNYTFVARSESIISYLGIHSFNAPPHGIKRVVSHKNWSTEPRGLLAFLLFPACLDRVPFFQSSGSLRSHPNRSAFIPITQHLSQLVSIYPNYLVFILILQHLSDLFTLEKYQTQEGASDVAQRFLGIDSTHLKLKIFRKIKHQWIYFCNAFEFHSTRNADRTEHNSRSPVSVEWD
jgi:hypothetical protein